MNKFNIKRKSLTWMIEDTTKTIDSSDGAKLSR